MNYKKFAVIGNPISHSKSPILFKYLFDTFKINAYYTRISLSSIEQFNTIRKYISLDGMNVTSPYKDKISDYLKNYLDVVNTVVFKPYLRFYNTDIYYLYDKINRIPKNSKVLVIGNGATSSIICKYLEKYNLDYDLIARNKKNLMEEKRFINLEYLNEIIDQYDVIFNTIHQCKNYINNNNKLENKIIIDSIYKDNFLEKISNNSIYFSGLDWLINQGIKSFEYFTEINEDKINTKIDYLTLKEHLKKNKHYTNIILIGYMQSGKTTLGKKLASELNMEFFDTDSFIEKSENKSISQIFANYGEQKFRELESQTITYLKKLKNTIISTGGGIINTNNYKNLKDIGFVVWLLRDPADSYIEDINRPNLYNFKNYLELFIKRSNKYFELADLIVINDKLDNAKLNLINEIKNLKNE